MWLPAALVKDVEHAGIRVFYVSYAATRVWAKEREPGEPLVFAGWYWALAAREAGPFKSRSSAYRDVWYRMIRHRGPPGVAWRNNLFEQQQQTEANARRRKVAGGRHLTVVAR